MKCRLAMLLAALDRLVNYFIPPEIAAQREARNRAHMFLVSHILGPFLGIVVVIVLYCVVPGQEFEVAVVFISITSFWIYPFALRMGTPYNPLALLSVQNLIFCILWSCYFYGGVNSPTLPWVLTIPLLAFFYLGSAVRLRLIVMVMFATNLVVFALLYSAGYGIRYHLPTAAMQGLGLVSTIAASIYVAMMALYYAKVLASQTELEVETREHMATASRLRQATAEAERANAAKGDFLSRMSHELRTPLNAVIGYSQILLEDAEREGSAQDIADLDKIQQAGQHLLTLVSAILEFSKIEAGKLELHREMTDLAEMIADIARRIEPAAGKNGNRLSCAIGHDLGIAMCDSARFRNMLGQLLDNAAKFTQNGEIGLVAAREASPQGDELVIHVVDTGIGIAADKIAGLFEKFTVAEDFSTSRYGGTGLGLALSQRLCELMGGDMLVESELGKGTRFTIQMPLRPVVRRENPDTTMTTAEPAVARTFPAPDAAAYGPALNAVAVTV